MAVNLSPIWGAGAQLLDNSGNVLSGGKIYTYAAGTTTQVTTYTSNTGVTANSNPIVLNSAGRVPYEIWLTDGQNYKFVLKDSNDVLIGTWDNLSGINSNFIAYTNQQEIQTATADQTVFNLTTMQYLVGTNSLSVFVDGVNQYGPGAQYAYEETDSDTVTFASGLHVGAEVKFTSSQIQNAGVTDASQISYTYPATNAVTQNVEERLAQYVSVKDFGAVGDGVADDTDAFNAAIAYANSKGGSDRVDIKGTTIFVPTGQYVISDGLDPITVSGVTISGVSKTSAVLLVSATNDVFTFGDTTQTNVVVGGGINNLKFEYPSTPTGSANIIKIAYAYQLSFDNLALQNTPTLAILGTSSTLTAGGVSFTNIQAAVANAGYPVFRLNYGAGLTLENCQMFVWGVLPPVNPASMTTVAGTNVFNCLNGNWDTVQVNNCIFERFYVGLAITAAVGTSVYQNFFFNNTVMDYFKNFCVYLETSSNCIIKTISFDKNCWFVSWEESCFFATTNTGAIDNCSISGTMPIAGKYAVYFNTPAAKQNIVCDLIVGAVNRLGVVQTAILLQAGSSGLTVTNCKGNLDNTGAGLPWRADYGVQLGLNSTNYIVTNCYLDGAVGGYSEAQHTELGNRLINNNINTNYAGYAGTVSLISGTPYVNYSGFRKNIIISGGTISAVAKDGVSIGTTAGLNLWLDPNESMTVTYSVLPTFHVYVEN